MRRGKRRRDTANPPPKPHPAGGGPVFGHRVRAIGRPLRRVHAARRPVAPNTVRSSSARRRAFGAFRIRPPGQEAPVTGSPGQPPDNRTAAEYSGSRPENRGSDRPHPPPRKERRTGASRITAPSVPACRSARTPSVHGPGEHKKPCESAIRRVCRFTRYFQWRIRDFIILFHAQSPIEYQQYTPRQYH